MERKDYIAERRKYIGEAYKREILLSNNPFESIAIASEKLKKHEARIHELRKLRIAMR